MTESILCLVCLCLLGWVATLKAEIAELKESADFLEKTPDTGGVVAKRSAAKGSRSFSIS